MLSGHPWRPSAHTRCRYTEPSAQLPAARCGLQDLMPDERLQVLQGRLPLSPTPFVRPRAPPRMRACRCSPSHLSVYLLADDQSLSSFGIPPACNRGLLSITAILTGLPLQLVLCGACCFPLASADGGIHASPGALVPSRLLATRQASVI